MWDSYLAHFLAVLKETWHVLAIGFTTASLAFLVGWTTLRKRKPKPKEEAVAKDDAPPKAGGTNERRNASRRGGHAISVDMHDPDDKLPHQQAYVLDRSVGGLCLMTPRALPIGSVWKVRPCNAPRTTPPVRVEVKSCTASDHEWKLGCQFEKTPSYAILLMFG